MVLKVKEGDRIQLYEILYQDYDEDPSAGPGTFKVSTIRPGLLHENGVGINLLLNKLHNRKYITGNFTTAYMRPRWLKNIGCMRIISLKK